MNLELNKEENRVMLHALGNPSKDKRITKALTFLDRCYRNRFIVSKHSEVWDGLILDEFADIFISKDSRGTKSYMYFVTEKGAEALLGR